MDECIEDMQYSDEGEATRALLYQGLNDINIYVEDKDKEYIYETIFKRMLGDKIRIKAIFSCGGKNGVIKTYNEYGKALESVPNLYLVDGDFDRYISPKEMIIDDCFIYLKAYNIENYFVNQDATESFIKGKLRCCDTEVRKRVKFKEWERQIIDQAKKLFLCYCLVEKEQIGIETIKRGAYAFINNKTGFEKDGAYEAYWKQVQNAIPNAEGKLKLLVASYQKINGNDYFNLICGKFLLDSLFVHLKRISNNAKFNRDEFNWWLIDHFDASKLDYVKKNILSMMNIADC